jgi:hypothetical protein
LEGLDRDFEAEAQVEFDSDRAVDALATEADRCAIRIRRDQWYEELILEVA